MHLYIHHNNDASLIIRYNGGQGMSLIDFYFIFPSIFMIHEMEEIVFMPKFVSKTLIGNFYIKIKLSYSPFNFNLVVFEEFLLLLITLGLSYKYNNFTIYQTIIIAYNYHVIGHIMQSLILRKYIPGVISGIITGLYCFYFINIFLKGNYHLFFYSFITLFIIFLNIILLFKIIDKFFPQRTN